jgi:hypothetical protein
MLDVGRLCFAIVFHFSHSRLWRLELEIRDNEVKVGKDCLRGFSYFFGVWTNCVNDRCYYSIEDGCDP